MFYFPQVFYLGKSISRCDRISTGQKIRGKEGDKTETVTESTGVTVHALICVDLAFVENEIMRKQT